MLLPGAARGTGDHAADRSAAALGGPAAVRPSLPRLPPGPGRGGCSHRGPAGQGRRRRGGTARKRSPGSCRSQRPMTSSNGRPATWKGWGLTETAGPVIMKPARHAADRPRTPPTARSHTAAQQPWPCRPASGLVAAIFLAASCLGSGTRISSTPVLVGRGDVVAGHALRQRPGQRKQVMTAVARCRGLSGPAPGSTPPNMTWTGCWPPSRAWWPASPGPVPP
jgi:hypothetical protein